VIGYLAHNYPLIHAFMSVPARRSRRETMAAHRIFKMAPKLSDYFHEGEIRSAKGTLDRPISGLAIDSRRATIYRRHVLSGLNDIYAQVASRRPVPTPLAQVLAARTIREWDSLTVVPRHGFDDVDHYYSSMSVGPRLAELAVPARIVHSTHDPMVPGWTYQDHLARAAGSRLVVEQLDRGGHVGFPAGARVESRTLEWLLQH